MLFNFQLSIFDQRFCADQGYLKAIKKYKIEVHARSIFLTGFTIIK